MKELVAPSSFIFVDFCFLINSAFSVFPFISLIQTPSTFLKAQITILYYLPFYLVLRSQSCIYFLFPKCLSQKIFLVCSLHTTKFLRKQVSYYSRNGAIHIPKLQNYYLLVYCQIKKSQHWRHGRKQRKKMNKFNSKN